MPIGKKDVLYKSCIKHTLFFQTMLSKYLHIERLICCTILSLRESYDSEDDSYSSAYLSTHHTMYVCKIDM